MRASLRAALLLPVALFFSACLGWSRVPAAPRELRGGLTLHPESEWSSLRYGAAHTWTVHGPPLEDVTILSGLTDGKSIARAASYKEKMPLFRRTMAASEVAEMFVETLLRSGYGAVDLLGVRPQQFAGRAGFRFELALVAPNGLEQAGFGVGTVANDKLYLIAFCAPKLHYFEAYRPAVEELIASARID